MEQAVGSDSQNVQGGAQWKASEGTAGGSIPANLEKEYQMCITDTKELIQIMLLNFDKITDALAGRGKLESSVLENAVVCRSITRNAGEESGKEDASTNAETEQQYRRYLIEAKQDLVRCMWNVDAIAIALVKEKQEQDRLLEENDLNRILQRPMMQQKAEALFNHLMEIPYADIKCVISAVCRVSPLTATHLHNIWKKISNHPKFKNTRLNRPKTHFYMNDVDETHWNESDNSTDDQLNSFSGTKLRDKAEDIVIPISGEAHFVEERCGRKQNKSSPKGRKKAGEIIANMKLMKLMKVDIDSFERELEGVTNIHDLTLYPDPMEGNDNSIQTSTLILCLMYIDEADCSRAIRSLIERFEELRKMEDTVPKRTTTIVRFSSDSPVGKKEENDIKSLADYLNYRNLHNETALHKAVRFRDISSVRLLYRTYGADMFIKDRFGHGQTALEMMYQFMPEEVNLILDSAVTTCEKNSKTGKLIISADFSVVIGKRYNKLVSALDDKAAKDYDGNGELGFLAHVVNSDSRTQKFFFPHPVIALFLAIQWKKYKEWILASVIMQILLKIFYALLVNEVFNHTCRYGMFTNGKRTPNEFTIVNSAASSLFNDGNPYYFCEVDLLWKVLAGILAFFAGFLLLVEIMELYYKIVEAFRRERELPLFSGAKNYFTQLENVFQLLCAASIVYICVAIFRQRLAYFDYSLAAASIILTSVLTLMDLGSFPWFSVYIQIFFKVTKSFVKFLGLYAVLIIAFAIAFGIVLPSEPSFQHFSGALTRVIVMMTGEIAYRDVNHVAVPKVTVTAQIVCSCYVLIMACIVANLLIGLTVSDVKKLTEDAEIVTMSVTLERCCTIQSTLQLWYWRWMLRPLKTLLQFMDSCIHGAQKIATKKTDESLSSLIQDEGEEQDPPEEMLPLHRLKLGSNTRIDLSELSEKMQIQFEQLFKKTQRDVASSA